MRSTILALCAVTGVALANPRMGRMMMELDRRQNTTAPPVELIGDLITPGATTPVGLQVKACLEGNGQNCVDSTTKVR
jgi:hypothetical protein